MTARAGLWLAMLLGGCASRSLTPLPRVQLRNGDMEQGTDSPTAWGEPLSGYKRQALSRDTKIRHGGQAALRFCLRGVSGERTLEQVLWGGEGREVTLKGWVKTEGQLHAQVGILLYDRRATALALSPGIELSKASDWHSFTQKLTVPADSPFFSVVLRARGEGTLWVDDLVLGGDHVETVAASANTILPPHHQPPDQPYPSVHGEAWHLAHQELKVKALRAKPNIVFLGDSLTAGWQNVGSAEWERYFKPLGSFNMGLGGDRTSQILWRIQDGALAGLHPKLVVLAVGINNLLSDTYPPERTAEGVLACVRAIERTCPGTKVLVVGIFPSRSDVRGPIHAQIRRVNSQLAAKLPWFLDLGSAFLKADGHPDENIFQDSVHPNSAGYTRYRERLYPSVLSLLKP
ncbi:MAG: GDSL-type esterase/lipase family protein [Armatimonadetes bacterium]|nr:GDSL-type esterase/lipase family protein [Armatimonadota bacterium]